MEVIWSRVLRVGWLNLIDCIEKSRVIQMFGRLIWMKTKISVEVFYMVSIIMHREVYMLKSNV